MNYFSDFFKKIFTLVRLPCSAWRGTGIPKILRETQKNGSPKPIFHTNNDRTVFLVEFPVHPVFAESLKQKEVTTEVKRLLLVVTEDYSRKELQNLLGLKNAEHFRKSYLLQAINAGLVEMTLPDKPKSRLQKYRLTETGQSLQKRLTGEIRVKT